MRMRRRIVTFLDNLPTVHHHIENTPKMNNVNVFNNKTEVIMSSVRHFKVFYSTDIVDLLTCIK